jgi:hypothetical protein
VDDLEEQLRIFIREVTAGERLGRRSPSPLSGIRNNLQSILMALSSMNIDPSTYEDISNKLRYVEKAISKSAKPKAVGVRGMEGPGKKWARHTSNEYRKSQGSNALGHQSADTRPLTQRSSTYKS